MQKIGGIYTTAWAGPAVSLARAGHGLVHSLLQSGPDSNQKFCIIIAPKAYLSSICPDYSSVLQTAERYYGVRAALSPYSGAELS